MVTRMIAIIFIFLCVSTAWFVLGGSVSIRTEQQDRKLKNAVGNLWGQVQRQRAPAVYYQTREKKKIETMIGTQKMTETKEEIICHPVSLSGSDIDVDLKIDYRKKGLLWYSTYIVGYRGDYQLSNETDQEREFHFNFYFPSQGAVYNEFLFKIGENEIRDIQINSGKVTGSVKLKPGESEKFKISYRSQGLDEWWYDFGSDVSQVKNFQLKMNTNFDRIDFPENSISPTDKNKTTTGWNLAWRYNNLLSGIQIGMVMPKKLNPGPWVSRVTFFAPVSLFFFFFLTLIFSMLRQIKIHPMNYFFLGCAFFSFHLLMAYLADHISIHWTFLISSVISIFLVISYMRLVVGIRKAFLEIGISQFVYLVLFSYAFFFEGYTGLTITILSIITLFIVMQYTGKVDWETIFKKKNEIQT